MTLKWNWLYKILKSPYNIITTNHNNSYLPIYIPKNKNHQEKRTIYIIYILKPQYNKTDYYSKLKQEKDFLYKNIERHVSQFSLTSWIDSSRK